MNQMPMPVTTQAMMMAPAEASAAMFWGQVVDASADHGADDDAYQADQANFFELSWADDAAGTGSGFVCHVSSPCLNVIEPPGGLPGRLDQGDTVGYAMSVSGSKSIA